MIVVEGPDGSGKSTLVTHLCRRFGLEVGKRGVANRDKLYEVTRQDTYRALSSAVLGSEPSFIWDRLWISEYVYHDIHPKRLCEFNPIETEFIHKVVDAIGCPFILCLPPLDVVRANEEGTHQMQGVHEALDHIWYVYAEGELPWPDNIIHYDYTGQTPGCADLDDVEEEIAGYLDVRKARQYGD